MEKPRRRSAREFIGLYFWFWAATMAMMVGKYIHGRSWLVIAIALVGIAALWLLLRTMAQRYPGFHRRHALILLCSWLVHSAAGYAFRLGGTAPVRLWGDVLDAGSAVAAIVVIDIATESAKDSSTTAMQSGAE